MLLVFRNFTFTYVSKTIVFIVLTVVETYTLTVLRHTHRNAKVDEPVTEVTHYEGHNAPDLRLGFWRVSWRD